MKAVGYCRASFGIFNWPDQLGKETYKPIWRPHKFYLEFYSGLREATTRPNSSLLYNWQRDILTIWGVIAIEEHLKGSLLRYHSVNLGKECHLYWEVLVCTKGWTYLQEHWEVHCFTLDWFLEEHVSPIRILSNIPEAIRESCLRANMRGESRRDYSVDSNNPLEGIS